jgi:hypothetical protein
MDNETMGTGTEVQDGATESEEVNEETIKSETEESTEEVDDQETTKSESEETKTEESTEEAPEVRQSRAQTRIKGLIEQNKTLAQELESLRTPKEPEKPATPTYAAANDILMPEVANHPAIKGRFVNDEGLVQADDGYLYSPQSLIREFNRDQKLANLENYVATQEQQKIESENRAKAQEIQKELQEAVVGSIQDERKAAFPQLDKAQAEKVDKQLIMLADGYVAQALKSGEVYSAELIDKATKTALTDLKETFGIFGAKQLKDNLQQKEQFKIKPDGQSGVKAEKSLHEMTDREKDGWAKKAALAAEAAHRTG